jgi:hypothetical protein
MAVAESIAQPAEQQVDKGLKSGALGLVSTTIIATASVAPAYSIAATLVFVVGAVALQSPAVAIRPARAARRVVPDRGNGPRGGLRASASPPTLGT